MRPINPQIRQALKIGWPIFLGYFPYGMAFGVLANQLSWSCGEALLMSVFVGMTTMVLLKSLTGS